MLLRPLVRGASGGRPICFPRRTLAHLHLRNMASQQGFKQVGARRFCLYRVCVSDPTSAGQRNPTSSLPPNVI